MLTSLALIFLMGLVLGELFKQIKLPRLLGMIIAGMILSPYGFDLLSPSIINISADLRQMALIIILTRAGLSLNVDDLKRVGRPAILMSFLPACFEIIGVTLIASRLLNISILDATIMGSILSAVSPAVVIPRMIRIMDEGYGKEAGIPQLIIASASIDDIFVIVLFSTLTSIAVSGNAALSGILQIPSSILLGVLIGISFGLGVITFFERFQIRDTIKVIIIVSISFLLVEVQNILENIVIISGLIAIMSIGVTIAQKNILLAKVLSSTYNKLWIGAEILLFVLVGATVDLSYALQAGLYAIIIILGGLIFRILGVYISLLKTKFTRKEKIFCMITYTAKATVQAAIGPVPLAIGLAHGQEILIVAVLSILITAPLGALGIDNLYTKLLKLE